MRPDLTQLSNRGFEFGELIGISRGESSGSHWCVEASREVEDTKLCVEMSDDRE